MQKILRTSAVMAIAGIAMMAYAPFASAASSISIDSLPPEGCQLSSTEVIITGEATADAPPGQLQQYAVDVDWGDGSSDTVLAEGSFGSGQGIGGPIPFNGAHTYDTPGSYAIVATIYHQSITGQDNVSTDGNAFVVCIVNPLTIEKTAEASFDREWDWTIDKTADQTDILLADGQLFGVNYTVTLGATSEDSNAVVSGTITITNPEGNVDVDIEGVTDVLSDFGVVDVECEGGLPRTLGGGDTLECTYSQALAGTVDQTNTATVDTDIDVLDASSDPVPVTFDDPTTEIDECVNVSDDNVGVGDLGTVCAEDADKTFDYSLDFGAHHQDADVVLSCGENSHTNTASFTSQDSDEGSSEDHTVDAVVECAGQGDGCTLTQGYWKTHNESFKGGAPTDDNWLSIIASAEQSLLLNSGLTWFNVFWTAPKNGNVWYQLAHQWMAAKLNEFNGADTPANVDTALALGQTWLSTYSPAAKIKGKDAADAAGWAALLGSYNEGNEGVPHCDEDETSQL